MANDVSDWIAQLSTNDPALQSEAAEALAKLGEKAKPAAPALAKNAGSAEETVREWAVAALEGLGPPRIDDQKALRELVLADCAEAAYWAITLLGRLEAEAGPAVPELTEALKQSPYPQNRQRAAWALGKIGPAASDALPALKAAANEADPRLARLAKRAVQSIADPG